LANFEVLAEAPNGIQRLREVVLELAVRGKLVEQDLSDESATELLKRIQAERIKLNKSAKGRMARPVPPVALDECPFDLPESWVWTRSAHIGIVNPRNEGLDEDIVAFVPMAVLSTDYRSSIRPEVRYWREIKKGYTHVADGDIAIAKITPCFENGKAAVFANLPGGYGAGTTELHVLRPIPGTIEPQFFLLFFKSPTFVRGGVATMTGTAGQQRVAGEYFTLRPVPLPPIAEQRRIVARVDELMALLDRLEAKRQEREAARSAARDSTLAALRDAPTPEDAETAWLRIQGQFGELFKATEDVEPLRQAILQLATKGRLVPQNPTDPSSAGLLEQIGALKSKGSPSRKRGRADSEHSPGEFNTPFHTPTGWSWTELRNILSECRNGLSTTPNDSGEGIRHLRISSATSDANWVVNTDDHRWVVASAEQVEQYRIQAGDLLSCRFNGNLRFV
jgi:type I restriction enzyme S subunit